MNINVKTEVTGNTARCHFTVSQSLSEDVTDMHYFCVSVIKDLVAQQHQIKAYDTTQTVTYPFDFNEDMINSFMEVMSYMQDIIIKEKLEREKNRNQFSDN